MSAGPDPRMDAQVIEQERRRLGRRLEEVARLCESNVPPGTFYGELLKRLIESLAALAGAVWIRTNQGHLQQAVQMNIAEVGLERTEETRQAHAELLRALIAQPRALDVPPHTTFGTPEPGKVGPGNATDFLLLLVPITQTDGCSGLLEVWQGANRARQAVPGFLQFMGHMAELAARYQRNQMLGQMTGQQQLWTQLEAFSRQIHSSLKVSEVAYLVANDGRRLIECDRVSVAIRRGTHTVIEAVSGSDTVEHRSNLVRLMRNLSDEVLTWGEKLSFTGTRDDALPPRVLDALDGYLAESQSKLLVVAPLRVERDAEPGKKAKIDTPRSALVMECFDPPLEQQTILGRLEVISKHAAPALKNAVDHQRIPMRFLWEPLAQLQEGLGGKTKTIILLSFVGLCLLISGLIFLPYPLKMDATGRLVPEIRHVVYPPHQGEVLSFDVMPGEVIKEGKQLAQLFDSDLQAKLGLLLQEAETAAALAREAETRSSINGGSPEASSQRVQAQIERFKHKSKMNQYTQLLKRTGALPDAQKTGTFTLQSPFFAPHEAARLSRKEWTVLSGSFREEWKGKSARPTDPILRLGAKEGPWEVELKIPQKHIGQILRAFDRLQVDILEVDFLVRSDATRVFQGKLSRERIAGEAVPNRDENATEPEPVVLAFVRIDDEGVDIKNKLPPELWHTDIEVRAKIRCGNRSAGYSLFYGVWEFLYEKVVFFF